MAVWGELCVLHPGPGALTCGTHTCGTLELGEDGLGLAVALPTLLQGQVAHVSNRCPHTLATRVLTPPAWA